MKIASVAVVALAGLSASACVHYETTDAIKGPLAAIDLAQHACSRLRPPFSDVPHHWTAWRDGDTWTVCTYIYDRGIKSCQGLTVTLNTHSGAAGPCEIVVIA